MQVTYSLWKPQPAFPRPHRMNVIPSDTPALSPLKRDRRIHIALHPYPIRAHRQGDLLAKDVARWSVKLGLQRVLPKREMTQFHKVGPKRKWKRSRSDLAVLLRVAMKGVDYVIVGIGGLVYLVLLVVFVVVVGVLLSYSLCYTLSKYFGAKMCQKVVQFWESCLRGSRTIMLFASMWVQLKTIELFITNEQLNIEMVNQVHDRIAPQLLRLVEDLGGLYIKFGQEVAAMRGIVPDQYCDTMAVLQDNVPSISFEEVSKLFKEDFGQGIEELFVSFEKEPIAAASLAQVHKAVLPDNRVVAVKVQYPRVKYFHDGDLLTHRVVGHFLSYFYKQFRKPSEEFYTALHAELNFKKEAEHAKRARKNFSHRKDIYVPDIVDNLSSERILTMEFIDGFKVNNLEAISKHGFSTASIAQLVFEGNAEQVFLHGFIHADLHPGNILVRPIPGKPDKPQVVFLDHGLYGSIGDEFRVGYCKFWMALVKGDEKTLIDWCKKYGISDYKILSSVLMIQQFDGIGTDLKDSAQTKKESKYSEFQALYKNMTPEQRRHFKERMDSVTEVMNTVPEELLFILRSSFLLRGVNRELGAPINRFAVMARVASRGATTSKAVVESELSYYEKSLLFVEGAKFEWILRLNTFRSWLFTKLYNISVVLGMNEKLQEIGFALLRYMGTVEEEGPALEASASHS